MSPTEISSRELRDRWERACSFDRPIDSGLVERKLTEFYQSGLKIGVPPITAVYSFEEYARAARAARDAWAARAAWAAWDARDAWDAWAAWAARDARDAWDAWDAWDARAARDAWAARAARDAWDAWAAWAARAARDAWDAWDAWDASWISLACIGALEIKKTDQFYLWFSVFEAFEAGMWAFLPLNEVCLWVQIPKLRTQKEVNRSTNQMRAGCHCETGPALELPKEKLWFIRGVLVPQYVVENPAAITVEDIDAEQNAEVRRIKIERYGQARYLIDAGAVQIHQDDFGILYRREFPNDEPLVMVKVVNSTPEPDGSFKDYFLRVPPFVERARQAVAWTFGKEEMEYAPEIQT